MHIYSFILLTILLLTGLLMNLPRVHLILETQYPINCDRQQVLVKKPDKSCDDKGDTRGCPRRES